ncbi:MAG: ferredoxin--NADP reductase [Thioalkalivibrionaceae bacterium]
MAAKIVEIIEITPKIRLFRFQTEPGRFKSLPGQWIDLVVPGARPNEAPMIGGYSVLSAPSTDGAFELAIKYADHHEATLHLHTKARVGDVVYVTPGQGRFVYTPEMGRHVVLLGAGIGVTPLISILRAIDRDHPDTRAHLVYSVVAPDEVLLRDEIETMGSKPNIDVTITVTRDAEDWAGHTGRISPSLLESLDLPRDALFYFCGSREFIDGMSEQLLAWGVAEDHLIYEKWW